MSVVRSNVYRSIDLPEMYAHEVQPMDKVGAYAPTGFQGRPNKARASRGGLKGLKRRTMKAIDLPDNFKYPAGTLTATRDQGQCGSCWAFGSLTSIQDRIMLHSQLNVPLSVQYVLDCVPINGGGDPCGGNDVGFALSKFPKDGIIAEAGYPYLQIGGGPVVDQCPNEKAGYRAVVKSQNYYLTEEFTGDAPSPKQIEANIVNMKSHIMAEGPIIGVMLQVFPDLNNYDGISVYEPSPGQKSDGGHCVEIIGWGKNNSGTEYWICRNSWGESWPAQHLQGMGVGWFYVKMRGASLMEHYAYAAIPTVVDSKDAPISDETDALPGDAIITPGNNPRDPIGGNIPPGPVTPPIVHKKNDHRDLLILSVIAVLGIILYKLHKSRRK